MSDQPKNSGSWIKVPAALFFLLASYLLSAGPLDWMTRNITPGTKFHTPIHETLMIVYTPVRWLCEESEMCKDVLHWYLKLWGSP